MVINARSQCKHMVYKVDRCKINNTFDIYNNTKLFYFYMYTFTFKGYLCFNYFTFLWLSDIKMAKDFVVNALSCARKVGNVSIIIR